MQHNAVDAFGNGQFVLCGTLEAGAYNFFYVIVQRVREHHFVVRGVGMAVHALGKCVQLFPHLARHIAAIFRPQFLIALKQLCRIKRQAARAQRQRPQQIGRTADRRAHAVQICLLYTSRCV